MLQIQEKRMSFFEHLAELRIRLIYIMLFFVGMFIICLIFQDTLMRVAVRPHLQAVSWLKSEGINVAPTLLGIRYTAPFLAYLKLCLVFAAFLSAPFAFYQIWGFVSAGLYTQERKFVTIYGLLSFLLFIVGSIFGYLVLIPYGLYFLARYADPSIIALQFSLGEYISLVILLTVIMGIIFELPLVMVFLSKIGVTTPQTFRKWRKFQIVITFFVAAVLTPGPDVFSQCMMAIPICFLYEIGIILSSITVKNKSRVETL
jgi:sec-independent protein translocase protein TatC